MQQQQGRRSRSGQAFRQQQRERCGQDSAGDAGGSLRDQNPKVACGEGEENPMISTKQEEQGTVPRAATLTLVSSLGSSLSAESNQDAPTVESRRGSLSTLPRMGFVVTRKSRTLSLDAFPRQAPSPVIFANLQRPMKILPVSRDDSCLPFISDSCSIAQVRKDLILSAHKSAPDDSPRSYDLVGSPGPKFLLLRISSQKDHGESSSRRHDEDSSSHKCAVSVPFKWEDAPGKPKAEAVPSQPQENDRAALQLPPRLLVRSFTGGRKLSPRQPSVKAVNGVRGDPSSPTSILTGPELTGSDSTSDSSAVESETVVVSDAESGTVSWNKEEKRRSFAARILHPEWLGIKRRSMRRSGEWGLESDHQLPSSGQMLLDIHQPDEDVNDVVNAAAADKKSGSEECVRSSCGEEIPVDGLTAGGETMYCGCTSPRIGPFSPSSRLRFLRSNSEKQKKWMVKRIRRSSRLFQMFFIKAVKQAVQPRRRRSSKFRFGPAEY